jgi:hypothetical protein
LFIRSHYKLERDKEKAEDWIWIVDHTVQLGHEKCLVILGIRQSRLPSIELYPAHEDVEPIALLPVKSSNGHDEIFDAQQMEDKLDWLKAYRDHLHQWQELIESVKTAEEYIKFVGIFDDCHIQLRDEVDFCATSPQAKRVWLELLVFIEQQSLKAKQNERLLGSSEVIESVFGKFKSLEQNQVKSGFTSLLLSLAATVSKTTKDTIEKAMKTVPTKKVRKWFEQVVGHKSVQAKRKLASDQIRKSEQKRDEIFDSC